MAPAGRQSILYWPAGTTNDLLQTVTNLGSTNWVTARTALPVNAELVTNTAPAGFFRRVTTTVPTGMALIPAGWFTMGDPLDGESDAVPTSIYMSAFVMDVKLVNYALWTNVYGLYDMAGNVFELCWDWYRSPLGLPTMMNPTGPPSGMYRVIRAGSWAATANDACCGSRASTTPNLADLDFGFRNVRGF